MSGATQALERYLEGAERKIAIAEYHLDELHRCVDEEPHTPIPAVPVQAHFEGVLQAFIAAADRVAAGVNKALNLGCETANLANVIKALRRADEDDPLATALKAWRYADITRDVANARRHVAHYTYVKSPATGDSWAVERYGKHWSGDRELRAYCRVAVDHLRELRDLMRRIRQEVGRR